jgi:hypothetical protein
MISESFEKLKKYCENEDFKGWDPYDGLNSKLFQALPFKHSRFFRLAWIQLFKRNPINLRSLVGIKKDYNAKGIGLFLHSYCLLYKSEPDPKLLDKIKYLSKLLISLKSEGYSGACWGYNFDWQARAFFQPKHTPTVVATTFNVYAILEAYDVLNDPELLDIARSSCDFVLKDLNRTVDKDGDFAFSYSPIDSTQVFNASLLGSRLLSKVYSYTGEEHLIKEAKKSVDFCVKYQGEKGEWAYSPLPFHKWVDNFHTGYNLECISEYQKYSGDTSYQKVIDTGFNYYINTFFTKEGISKYYNNSTFPIDIHAPAQLIVTLRSLDKLAEYKELADRVLKWTIVNMQSEKGFFSFQKKKRFVSKIPYIRWAQGWMFYALSNYKSEFKDEQN